MKITLQQKDGTVIGECNAVADKSILDILTDNNIQIPYSCKMGICGLCLCNIVSGGEYIIKQDYMPTEDGMCLACTSFVEDTDGEIVLQLIQ